MKFANREENFRHLQICIQIESHLIHIHKVSPKREWYLILDEEDHIISSPLPEITMAQKARGGRYRNPDIMWWKDGLHILEIDGIIHHIKSANTAKRNKIYKNNNCKFIVIEIFEMIDGKIKNKSIESILQELDSKI